MSWWQHLLLLEILSGVRTDECELAIDDDTAESKLKLQSCSVASTCVRTVLEGLSVNEIGVRRVLAATLQSDLSFAEVLLVELCCCLPFYFLSVGSDLIAEIGDRTGSSRQCYLKVVLTLASTNSHCVEH